MITYNMILKDLEYGAQVLWATCMIYNKIIILWYFLYNFWSFQPLIIIIIYTFIVWKRETRSLCKMSYFTEDRKPYRFGTTWGWVNDRIFIISSTIPLKQAHCSRSVFIHTSQSGLIPSINSSVKTGCACDFSLKEAVNEEQLGSHG